jgi:hypothetical protein
MRKLLPVALSSAALIVAAAGGAMAQDKAVPARPLTPDSLGAGAIKKPGSMDSEAMEKRRVPAPIPDKSKAGDLAPYRSYTDNEADRAGAAVAGGLSASRLIGAEVRNVSGAEVGEVQDLLIGPGKAVNLAIVEVGGFLGLGSKTVAIGLDRLNEIPDRREFTTTMTTEELKALPRYRKVQGSWVRADK